MRLRKGKQFWWYYKTDVRDAVTEWGWITEVGLPATVILMRLGRGQGWLTDYRCGYVAVNKGSPLEGMDYNDMVDVVVHGGVTYSGNNWRVGFKDQWVFGFDCNHWGDDRDTKGLEFCIQECESLAKQLVVLENESISA